MYIGWPNCGPSGTDYLQRATLKTGMSGLRGLGCGCGCGGGCGQRGLGQLPGGLFSSGWDISGWGIGEWAIVAVGAFALVSMFQSTGRGYRRARKTARRIGSYPRRRRAARAEQLREEAARLEAA